MNLAHKFVGLLCFDFSKKSEEQLCLNWRFSQNPKFLRHKFVHMPIFKIDLSLRNPILGESLTCKSEQVCYCKIQGWKSVSTPLILSRTPWSHLWPCPGGLGANVPVVSGISWALDFCSRSQSQWNPWSALPFLLVGACHLLLPYNKIWKCEILARASKIWVFCSFWFYFNAYIALIKYENVKCWKMPQVFGFSVVFGSILTLISP